MIGLDTNVVIRYLVQDDPLQGARATQFIEQRLTRSNRGFITIVAMVETVWVLGSFYRLGNKEIASAVERLLTSSTLTVEQEDDVFDAMAALEQGMADFADVLIAKGGSRFGCTHSVTFDKEAQRLQGFAPVP